MGQYFRLIDLDLMVSLDDMGKLGENVQESFDKVIEAICEVDTPRGLVAAVKEPETVRIDRQEADPKYVAWACSLRPPCVEASISRQEVRVS